MGQKIYKIEKVIMPSTSGRLRMAQIEEVDLIAHPPDKFEDESLPPPECKSPGERQPHQD